jgi:hypothetical protein
MESAALLSLYFVKKSTAAAVNWHKRKEITSYILRPKKIELGFLYDTMKPEINRRKQEVS